MVEESFEHRVRQAAFRWLDEQIEIHGDVLPRSLLAGGFMYQEQRVPLLGPQGIFKPRLLELPLSITTIPSGPYEDGYTPEGLLLYRYRGTDPQHRDNVGLRHCMTHRIPLVYFHRVVEGKYLVVWPVFVVGDNPATLTFKVEMDDAKYLGNSLTDHSAVFRVEDDATEARRSYITATVRQRVHQRTFRERVLHASRNNVRYAGYIMRNCWMLRISFPIQNPMAIPWFPMAWPCANCTMPPSTGNSLVSGQIMSLRFAVTSWRRKTVQCCSTG